MFIDEDGKESDISTSKARRVSKLCSRCREKFDGSDKLFSHCWSFFWKEFDAPYDFEQLTETLDSIAAARVNNPRSSFYIHGE